VPLTFPGNELPDPIPDATDKVTGYPITVTFPPRVQVQDAEGWLEEEAGKVAVWLSTPDKPANPAHAALQRNTVCLIARRPLRPGTRYTVRLKARVDGRDWSRTWAFTTVNSEVIRKETDAKVFARLNDYRRAAGLTPVTLDEDLSRDCAAHAGYLTRNIDRPTLNWRDEEPDLPRYSEEGRRVAARATIRAGGGAEDAIDFQMGSLINRTLVLAPGLKKVGIGNAPNASRGRIWVLSILPAIDTDPRTPALLYPARGQKEVPLRYPSGERPSPVPEEAKGKDVGYAVSARFAYGTRVAGAKARLADGSGREVASWLFAPEKPALPGQQQFWIGLIPKAPLEPGTRYTATFKALVAGRPWEQTWGFTTRPAGPDRGAVAARVLQKVNAFRRSAGLPPVSLDDGLSRGCLLHARYVAANALHPAVRGLGVHNEDPTLPGATPEGARAGKAGVITDAGRPEDAPDGWMSTLYHRLPLLDPDLKRIGFAFARMPNRNWLSVLDAGGGK
jgi:uncharacterized protein YkwD